MADVTKIITVAITRETSFPSSDSFGVGGIMSEFTPGNLNTPMQGATGRYKKYTSLKTMEQDGWSETDHIYRAAEAYFGNPKNPKTFIVGLRKAADADWAEALTAIKKENNEWYGFSCILSTTELSTPALFHAAIVEIADWTELEIKLFLFSTAQMGAIGELILLSAGNFTSGKPGVLANFQTVDKGQFNISKDGAADVVVKDINMTSTATAGEFETGSVSGNLSDFQASSDGEFSITLDGGIATDIAGIDTSSVTSFAGVAAAIQAAIQAEGGLFAVVTAKYVSAVNKIVITSGTTGATSAVVIAVAGAPAGTDLTGVNYLNGGVSEPGKVAGTVASYADVATALQSAITAAGVTGVTVTYNATDLRFIFTSGTTGKDSSVNISAVTDQDGDDLTEADYLNSGVLVYGTDAGTTPGTDDIGTLLKGQYDRTGWLYHSKARDADHIAVADVNWIEFAWMSLLFAGYEPAEATWAFKSLDSNTQVEVDTITNEQDEFVRGNFGNTYTLTGGSNITLNGQVCGGEYLDIMRGTDWLQSILVEKAYVPLVSNPKVALTDAGIGLEENAIRGALIGAEVNLLDAAYTVLTAPKEADITKTDKAARTVDGFLFTGRYQSAIQKVGIEGTIGL
jgi:hypothetical protein